MSVLRVVEPFAADVNGVPRVYRAGDLVHSSDPVVTKSRAMFFVEVEEFASRGRTTEMATAAPGGRRSRTKPAKPRKAAAKKAAPAKKATPAKAAEAPPTPVVEPPAEPVVEPPAPSED